MFKKLRRYLLAGFLVCAPAFITIYVILALLRITDRWVKSLLPAGWHDEMNIFGIPGVSLLFLLILLIAIGYFASGWIGRALVGIADGLFTSTPVVSSLYSTLKNLLNTLLGENTTAFRQVVYVKFPHEGVWSIGFVTGSVDEEATLPPCLTCVFVPTTPNPTSGFLIMVPAEEIRVSAMTVEQALKTVVSLGMTR